jgi:hypothetical protein
MRRDGAAATGSIANQVNDAPRSGDPRDAYFRNLNNAELLSRGLASKQQGGELASADTTPRTKTAAVQITRLSPTFLRHPCRHIQRIHPSTSSAAPTAFQGASRRFFHASAAECATA